MENASEGAKRPSGGRVWEGGHEGAFVFLRLKLNDLVHTLGGFFWKKLWIKKVRRKFIFMENVCFLHYRITGNVKSKHKQYDHWHSQDFSTGSQSEGAKRPSGGMVWDHGIGRFLKKKKKIAHYFFCLVSPINGGLGPCTPLYLRQWQWCSQDLLTGVGAKWRSYRAGEGAVPLPR